MLIIKNIDASQPKTIDENVMLLIMPFSKTSHSVTLSLTINVVSFICKFTNMRMQKIDQFASLGNFEIFTILETLET